MKQLPYDQLSIRYTKTRFTIQFTEDCELPLHKGSMIRGGIGEMLLRSHCIRDRDCKNCDFDSECIVQRTMYSKIPEAPEFMSEGDSVGYVLECESLRTCLCAGDTIDFYLILFGKTIVYFSQYLNAIYALGVYGVGKDHAAFQIVRIRNTQGRDIMQGQNIQMGSYQVELLEEYVKRREKELEEVCRKNTQEPITYHLYFRSPLSIKYHGEMLNEFHMDAILRALI